MKETLVIDIRCNVAKKYCRGRVYAIRFAKDMIEEQIRESLKNNPPMKTDWKPYDESTDAFLD